jgi:tetratricopeptide (TPR) repeat protein
MALALVDLKRFDEAFELYEKALSVMNKSDNGLLEVAITYLNIASLKEVELGIENSTEIINDYLQKAMKLLDEHETRDGYYAFVCEKCASVFDYYGHFIYYQDLLERAREIYERS